MRIFIFILNLGIAFLKKNLKEFFIDRGNFIIYFFTILFYQALFIIFMSVIFQYVPNIKGWNFFEILFIFGFFNIVSGIFYLIFAWTLWFPTKYLLTGKLDVLLVLPINSFLGILLEELGRSVSEIITIFLGILYVTLSILKLNINLNLINLFYFLLNVLSGVLILGGIFTIFTSFSFFFKSRTPMVTPLIYFMELAQYPIDIFNKWLRVFLIYILPIAFAGFFPAVSIIRPYEYKNFQFLTFFVSVFVFFISLILWHLSIRKYESAGN